MRTQIKLLLFLLIFSSTLTSCEDVVDVDLETGESRLVVNAPLQWQKGMDGSFQYVELTKTAGFYEDSPSGVSGATVKIRDSEGNTFYFEESQTPGRYECFDFAPLENKEYELEIINEGETFIAKEKLYPVVSFETTEQINFDGFGEEMEVRAYFTDPEDEENYYMVEDINTNQQVPALHPFSDHFFNGNTYYSSHFEEDLEPQEEVKFKIYGISSRHHDYLVKVVTSYTGGPFQTVPGLIRGNIENITNPENYAFGYFSLSETNTITHVVE